MNFTIKKGDVEVFAESEGQHTMVSMYFNGDLIDKIPVASDDVVDSAKTIMSGAIAMLSTQNQML